MDAIECMKTRRSVRRFEPRPVPHGTTMEIIDCARHAPSSMNAQPCIFMAINDPKTMAALAALRKGHEWLAAAPSAIAVCVDSTKSKRWVEDGSIAATHILLVAHALGLGACWVALRFDDPALTARFQQALGVPGTLMPICLVALGYPAEEPAPRQLRRLHDVAR